MKNDGELADSIFWFVLFFQALAIFMYLFGQWTIPLWSLVLITFLPLGFILCLTLFVVMCMILGVIYVMFGGLFRR